MAQAHPTVEPEQRETDTFAVFRAMPGKPNMELIANVEVPRYSQPDASGVELDTSKRLSLAVARAVERDDTFIESAHDSGVEVQAGYEYIEGEEFMVMHDLDKPMDFVAYVQNPAFEGVWDPEEES